MFSLVAYMKRSIAFGGAGSVCSAEGTRSRWTQVAADPAQRRPALSVARSLLLVLALAPTTYAKDAFAVSIGLAEPRPWTRPATNPCAGLCGDRWALERMRSVMPAEVHAELERRIEAGAPLEGYSVASGDDIRAMSYAKNRRPLYGLLAADRAVRRRRHLPGARLCLGPWRRALPLRASRRLRQLGADRRAERPGGHRRTVLLALARHPGPSGRARRRHHHRRRGHGPAGAGHRRPVALENAEPTAAQRRRRRAADGRRTGCTVAGFSGGSGGFGLGGGSFRGRPRGAANGAPAGVPQPLGSDWPPLATAGTTFWAALPHSSPTPPEAGLGPIGNGPLPPRGHGATPPGGDPLPPISKGPAHPAPPGWTPPGWTPPDPDLPYQPRDGTVPAAVPLPGTLALLVGSLVGSFGALGALRRRRA